MHKIKEKLWRELDEIAGKAEFSSRDIDAIHVLTDTIKNIDKIEMLEDGEGGGYSGARHWVRGHYSRDGYDRDREGGYPERRDARGRYARDGSDGYSRDGREAMRDHLEAAMATAGPEDRGMIERLLDKMK